MCFDYYCGVTVCVCYSLVLQMFEDEPYLNYLIYFNAFYSMGAWYFFCAAVLWGPHTVCLRSLMKQKQLCFQPIAFQLVHDLKKRIFSRHKGTHLLFITNRLLTLNITKFGHVEFIEGKLLDRWKCKNVSNVQVAWSCTCTWDLSNRTQLVKLE